MTTWIYRFVLFILLFGLSSLTHGINYTSTLLNALVNLSPLFSIAVFVLGYFRLPGLYKLLAWALLLGVILLVLESKYEYNQFVYSYFVIKRFAYCGVALSAYYIASKAEPLKIRQAVDLIFVLFFIHQVLMGRIFSYSFSSDDRTMLSPDAYYFVIPFLYYFILYLKQHRVIHLLVALFSFVFIVFMLHRTVISATLVAAGVIVALSMLGKVSAGGLPLIRTIFFLALLVVIASPFVGLLPEKKVDAVLTSLGGILSPQEDNTGSWRVEQAEYYLGQVPERPLFGWRYKGYDRGEVMENADFEEKGTIIHSQYVDMLYNYGVVGLLIHLTLILSALVALYRSGRVLSIDHLVLFGFIASGLVYGVSYQFPVYFWGFVGVGMYVGLKRSPIYFTPSEPTTDALNYGDASPIISPSKSPIYS